ncbi:guanylate kinase [Lachnospiraceae bacterium HCP1S3_C3]|nr:guanylate kinase [Lachnospiraceae bacterium]MDD6858675.1 guanylate kinase [Lachnospiraceae bacterium]
MNKGVLVVISGFSGSGKGTMMKELVSNYEGYALSISATTRKPREGEEDGREYFFKTEEEFKKMISEDAFLEHACYVGNYYGTPKAYVEKMLNEGKNVLLEIEIQGALNIKKQMPDAALIFILPPSAEELKRRLIGRGTESMDVIEARLNRAKEEAEGIENYDYVIVNDKLDESVAALDNLITGLKCGTFRNIDFINKIRDGVKRF